MSANLNYKNNRAAVMVATDVNGPAWHGLGSVVSAQKWADAMVLAQMDWQVKKVQLDNPLIPNTKMPAWGIFRDDTKELLGTVGENYTPIQNIKMGEHVDNILKDIDGAHYESAGVLGNGNQVWSMARIPKDIKINGTDDITKNFLLCSTSHDGSKAYTLKLVNLRVVCNNTLTRALTESSKNVRVKHTVNALGKLESKVKEVDSIMMLIDDTNKKMNELALRKMTKESNEKVMENMFGKDWKDSTRSRNQIQQIYQLFSSNDNNAFPEIKGTAYNLLNAVTNYYDHEVGIRQTDGRMSLTTEQIRTEGALWGSGEKAKSEALKYILEATEFNPRRDPKIQVAVSSQPSKDLNFILNNVQV